MQMMSGPMNIKYPVEAMKVEPMKIEYPVAKTFIQYPALRTPSLEAFFAERETLSCPASRMASIDEDDENTAAPSTPTASSVSFDAIAQEMKYTVKNTFIDYPAWESMRNPSLEGFFQERQIQSCPTTPATPVDDAHWLLNPLDSIPEPPGLECRFAEEKPLNVEPLNQALRSLSLEECLRDIEAKYQDLEVYDDVTSTKANTNEDTAPPTPEILSESEEENRPRTISLTSSLGLWSVGSAEHSLGTCKPCAFLWKSQDGCESGTNCKFCHMCPPGEVQRRKKHKVAVRKMVRQFQRPQAFQQSQAAGYRPGNYQMF